MGDAVSPSSSDGGKVFLREGRKGPLESRLKGVFLCLDKPY